MADVTAREFYQELLELCKKAEPEDDGTFTAPELAAQCKQGQDKPIGLYGADQVVRESLRTGLIEPCKVMRRNRVGVLQTRWGYRRIER